MAPLTRIQAALALGAQLAGLFMIGTSVCGGQRRVASFGGLVLRSFELGFDLNRPKTRRLSDLPWGNFDNER
jgi:hypothetical protein